MGNANNTGAVKEAGSDYGEKFDQEALGRSITYSVYPAFQTFQSAKHFRLVSRHVHGEGYRFFMIFSGRVATLDGTLVVPSDATLINETCAEWPVDHGKVCKLLDSLQNIQINLLAEGSLGCDGTLYELEYKSCLTEAKFHWGFRLPKEWAALGNIVDQFLALGWPQNAA